jgi:two-component system chemotaxis sensor kinase CheA
MVRDLAREEVKEVRLRVVGADTELDKSVLELLKDPLVHLVRNAVGHGIEPPGDREARGKPREGTITLEARSEGRTAVIAVADDGAGIDARRVKEAALRRGIIQPQDAAALDEPELVALVFRPGLSTSAAVTDLSGRGVGLDVVRGNVERLHGRIEVDSSPGRGTRFRITLPLTLTTTHALLVRARGQTFAIPLASVERIVRLPSGEGAAMAGRRALRFLDRPVALVGLADVLGLPPHPAGGGDEVTGGPPTAVIVAAAERRAAFLVDGLLGEQEIVAKSLGPQLPRVRHTAGASILGTGEVVIILSAVDLVASAQRVQVHEKTAAPGQAGPPRRRAVLVVDDSITTRTLEKSILEAAGYEVRVATDGVEAWTILQQTGCDLVVADVMMPRMDGFELTRRVRGDPTLKRLPVILVTSLESREDKERGAAAGADAYIVKGAFDQDTFLETVRRLL